MRRGDIRNAAAYADARCNWGWLQGCFGSTRISPSDIDFIVERNWQYLVGEIKPPGVRPTEGQRILLRGLARIQGFTVFGLQAEIVNHEIRSVHKMAVLDTFGNGLWKPATTEQFRAYVAAWFERADSIRAA